MKSDDEYVSARVFAKRSNQAYWNEAPEKISRHVVYNKMPPVAIDLNATPTSETCRQADRLFDDRIKQSEAFKSMKEHDKRVYWHKLVHATKQAIYYHGYVMSPRDRERGECSHANLQVVQCAVDAGLLFEQRSPPGSPKMSRLLPMDEIRCNTECDPWEFDPDQSYQYVFLRDRKTKDELPFDSKHPVAAKYQKRLAKINEVNGLFDIYYRPFCEWDDEFQSRRQLRPVHYARFTDSFDLHGRIYTGKYGQQGLRKVERATIEFQMEPHVLEPSVELDYGSYHTRMAYHLAGIDYRDDPYALWGRKTTPPMRLLAKTLINAAFSAKDAKATISACNMARYPRTKGGQWKDGKARDTALLLDRACHKTGLSFKGVYELALKRHSRIAERFSSDAGMEFMRIDSEIALNIMYHFAKQDLPCLGVHDSFIVPRTAKSELRRVMRNKYRRKLGFLPIIK